jgi:periplasmic protein TonB
VLSAIREAIFFPKKALKEGNHGEVIVKFAITSDGSISGLHIAKTSGSSILDEAALKIVRKAGTKFPPIPEAWNKESVDYAVPILFKERKR